MALYQVETGGRRYGVIATIYNHYVMDDDGLLTVSSGPAWCGRCRTFVDAETLYTVEEFDRRIRAAEEYRATPGLMPDEAEYYFIAIDARNLEKLRRAREWRSRRVSPPKCLGCGSEEVVAIDPLNQWIEVPGVGPCKAEFGGFADVGVSTRYFTPEGVRIRREELPAKVLEEIPRRNAGPRRRRGLWRIFGR